MNGIFERRYCDSENCAVISVESGIGGVGGIKVVEQSVNKQGEQRWAVNAALECAAIDRNLKCEHLRDGIADSRCVFG
jgi:hypothetical protein